MIAARAIAALAGALRQAGVRVGPEQAAALAEALGWVDPAARRDVYLAARATLVTRREDAPLFEAVFAAWFPAEAAPATAAPVQVPRAPRHDRRAPRPALVSLMAERAAGSAEPVDVPEAARGASAAEALRRKAFAACTPAELAALARAMRELSVQLTLRVTPRRVAATRGDALDLRRTLREAARLGGRPAVLRHRRRKRVHRPLVAVADVSGSMELYTRLLLLFLHGVTQRHPRTETFVFATRLTRLTEALRARSPDLALGLAAQGAADLAGGTRIGACLEELARRHARHALGRGAVLLIVSDGWDTGDPAQLGAAIARLAARCHRVVWLSPHAGVPGYAPRVRGLAAALAHIDDLLPIRDLQSLHDLARHLGRIPRRRGGASRFRPRPTA